MKTQITTSAHHEMLQTVGSRPAESGGLLLGSRKDYVITKFLYDKDAKTTNSSYTFNAPYLNKELKKLWEEEKLELLGFFHTHPQGYRHLSQPDKDYFKKQFENIEVEKFLTPLMFSAKDGQYDFIPYIVFRNGDVVKSELEILPNDYKQYLSTSEIAVFDFEEIKQTANAILEKVESIKEKQIQQPLPVVVEQIVPEEDFVYFLINFPFKKFRIFLLHSFFLMVTVFASASIIDFYLLLIKHLRSL